MSLRSAHLIPPKKRAPSAALSGQIRPDDVVVVVSYRNSSSPHRQGANKPKRGTEAQRVERRGWNGRHDGVTQLFPARPVLMKAQPLWVAARRETHEATQRREKVERIVGLGIMTSAERRVRGRYLGEETEKYA